MPQISLRDNEGTTHKGLKRLASSNKEGNPFKKRSLSYIALELVNSERSLNSYLDEFAPEELKKNTTGSLS